MILETISPSSANEYSMHIYLSSCSHKELLKHIPNLSNDKMHIIDCRQLALVMSILENGVWCINSSVGIS